jgi:hypothetical protein
MTIDDCCPTCGHRFIVSDWPWCPHGQGTNSVVPDDYGKDIVCETMGHEPVTYRTRSERRRLMKAHNLEEFVRHQPPPGSDHSPHTVNWHTSVDLDAATRFLDRPKQEIGHLPETVVDSSRTRDEMASAANVCQCPTPVFVKRPSGSIYCQTCGGGPKATNVPRSRP